MVRKADRISLSKGRIWSEAVRISVTSCLEMKASSEESSNEGFAALQTPASSGSAKISTLDRQDLVCGLYCEHISAVDFAL